MTKVSTSSSKVRSSPRVGGKITLTNEPLDLRGIVDVAIEACRPSIAGTVAMTEFSPEIVFLDIGLSGMDGYEVARQVRANPSTASIVLVALTGWGSAADQQRSRDAGFDTHLTKPIQFAVGRYA